MNFEVPRHFTSPHYRFLIHETGWFVVVRRAPLGLGWLSRCEAGPLYRGPVFPGLWWWRPTYKGAHGVAYREARKAPKR